MAHFNLENFAASISKTGIARPNRFEAEILFPAAVESVYGGSGRAVSIRVKSLTLPGKNISTVTNDTIYGPTHELAAGLTYADEITFTFLLSSDLNEKRRFDTWQNWIYSQRTFNMNFYEEYISTINIYQLNENDERVYGCQIREVFPKSVNPIEYTNETASAQLDLQVAFAFKEWVELDDFGRSPNPPAIRETNPTIHYPSNPIDRDLRAEQNAKEQIAEAQRILQSVGGQQEGD